MICCVVCFVFVHVLSSAGMRVRLDKSLEDIRHL